VQPLLNHGYTVATSKSELFHKIGASCHRVLSESVPETLSFAASISVLVRIADKLLNNHAKPAVMQIALSPRSVIL
jgi:hypothetical protein